MRGVELVTGNISPTMVLNSTIANNRFTPENKNTAMLESVLNVCFIHNYLN